ncbi:MAG: hypothetical protein R3C49_14755 [Planctomycetaceae bacterium]
MNLSARFRTTHHSAAIAVAVILLMLSGCGQRASTSTADSVHSENDPASDSLVPLQHDEKPAAATSSPERSDDPLSERSNSVKPVARDNPAAPETLMPTGAASPVAAVSNPPNADRRRMRDDRPALNEARLSAAGIQIYRGRRLVLLSDLPELQVQSLPALADRLFERLEDWFGPLPPADDGSDFQLTGCLIGDQRKFQQAGLMPSESLSFQHGRHWNYQFWMFNPADDYYRRHLLLHEFTHCFMTCESGMVDIPPLWYIEGMAEYFATHQSGAGDSEPDFGILPDRFEGFEGWGRLTELRRSFPSTAVRTSSDAVPLPIEPLDQVMRNTNRNFDLYAQTWALCWLLNHHPVYSEAFRPLRRIRTRLPFIEAAEQIRQPLETQLAVDWLLFRETVREGFDPQRCFPVHAQKTFTVADCRQQTQVLKIRSDLDWQESGLVLKAGETVRIVCEGRYVVNHETTDWTSEPQGVSIEYERGFPLGQVVGVLTDPAGRQITQRFSIGRGADIVAPFDASLWLQTNDTCDHRHRHSGTVTVTIGQ